MIPTPEQLSKLPKWAQDHIRDIARQRETAVNVLNEFVNDDTPSPFFFEDYACTGECQGPSNKRRYIQAHSVTVVWRGVELRVSANDYGNSGRGIGLSWGTEGGRHQDVAFIPSNYLSARLVSKEDMS